MLQKIKYAFICLLASCTLSFAVPSFAYAELIEDVSGRQFNDVTTRNLIALLYGSVGAYYDSNIGDWKFYIDETYDSYNGLFAFLESQFDYQRTRLEWRLLEFFVSLSQELSVINDHYVYEIVPYLESIDRALYEFTEGGNFPWLNAVTANLRELNQYFVDYVVPFLSTYEPGTGNISDLSALIEILEDIDDDINDIWKLLFAEDVFGGAETLLEWLVGDYAVQEIFDAIQQLMNMARHVFPFAVPFWIIDLGVMLVDTPTVPFIDIVVPFPTGEENIAIDLKDFEFVHVFSYAFILLAYVSLLAHNVQRFVYKVASE